ncbi:MAG: SusC/RagA family TonB-linked outer membrane protein [Flavobacteriaceae bacterium]|nr:SusC/RagA family TonB-linked outer membrane protein [Flavobacteriaceae bacterium]
MKQIRQLILGILFLLPLLMSAQDVIKGNVKDATGTELPGVSIMVKGTTNGTATDFDGNFELQVDDANAILVFSYVGYETLELAISASMQVTLQESAENLEEVILIGYGQTTKKDATGAVEKVGVEEFNTGAIASPEQLITGKTAGVNVVPPSGRPGEGGTIKIRGGISSITNNSPLIVIDGVPIDQQDGPALNSINPNDIESFNILKDASSTAIYGSRATNGVILITTKSGKMNRDMKVSFSSNFSSGEASNTVDVLSREEFISAINGLPNNENQVPLIGDANTDWQDQIYQTAFGTDNNFTISEGFDNTSYRASIGYTKQEGILKTSEFTRKNISFNLRQNLFDNNLKMDFNIRASFIGDDFADGGAIGAAVNFDPTKPVHSGNSQYGGYWEWLDPNSSGGNEPFLLSDRNPVGLLMQNTNHASTERYLGNAKFDYKLGFVDGLSIVANLGFDYSEVSGKTLTPATSASGFFNGGTEGTYGSQKRNTLVDVYLNYANQFGAHKIDAMLGQSFQDFYRENNSFGVDANGAETSVYTATTNALLSYMARLNYTYNSKYLVTLTYRRDGSSRFHADNRWGNFFSGAVAWNIAEEDFLKGSETLSTLKLRVGYGETGQQEINQDFGYLPTYTPGGDNVRYQFGDRFVYTIRPEEYDKNIKWEESATYNIGLDYGFSNDRITGSIEYFSRESTDILNRISIPAGSNLSNELFTNIGDIDSKGVEFSINADIVQTENFTWNVGFNATWLENKISKLNNVFDPTSPGIAVGGISGGVGNNVQTHKVGSPQFSYLVYKQVYDSNGSPLEGVYVDLNDDGVLNDQDKYIYKSPNPDYLMGFSSYMNYKNFDLNFVMRASIGNYAYNNVASSNGDATRLRPSNVISNVHSSYIETGFQNAQFWSDYWVQDASFLKMDNVTLGYEFENIKEGEVGLRIYSTLQNVFTITDYDGLDPEINGGIDNNFYPRPRTFLIGFNLNF